jgi:5-methylthioadenosine/S-adenosylhomocysteine deaminase
MAHADLLIKPRWIVPVEPAGQVLEGYCLAVNRGRIEAIVPDDEAVQFEADEVVELPGHALLPGLVNAHTHTAMSLLRGLADDLPLMTWLHEHIWPAEGRFVSPDFVRDGAELAVAEMLAGGTTCFNDMYFFPDVVGAVSRRAGMRACVGLIVIDLPSPWAKDTDEYFRKALEVHDEAKSEPLVTTCFAPHSPYMVNEDALKHLRVVADELDIPITMHVHETAQEVSDSERDFGMRPLARLKHLGLVNPSLAAVHMTQLTSEELDLAARTGISVIHCPESNLKLASGTCPVAELDTAGVNLALGTDGAASNNDLDMFGEMRTAALLAKGASGDPAALPATRVLEMATLNGARALGLEAEIGSLAPGKAADCIAVDLSQPTCQPVYEVVSQLIYATGRHQVTDGWVAGDRVVERGRPTRLDLDAIGERAHHWSRRIESADADEA